MSASLASSPRRRRVKLKEGEASALRGFQAQRMELAAKLGAAMLELQKLQSTVYQQTMQSLREEAALGNELAQRYGFDKGANVRFDPASGELIS